MIKVIEGHKVKADANIQSMFLKYRSNSMQYPGFIGAENLVNAKDISNVLFVSTWNALDNWKSWEKSTTRKNIYQKNKNSLVDDPKLSIFRLVPTQW